MDERTGGELLARIKGVRNKLSQELGFLMHPVHIRDNLELPPNAYRITLLGVPVGEGEVSRRSRAGHQSGPGLRHRARRSSGKDPASVWTRSGSMPADATRRSAMGYTVVDAATVIATHLSRALKEHANELLGHEEVQKLLDVLAASHRSWSRTWCRRRSSCAVLLKVLQNLLAEEVPIRDMRTIAETLAQNASLHQNADALTAAVRVALGRAIVQSIAGTVPELPLIAMDPTLEQILLNTLGGTADSSGEVGTLEPGLADSLQRSVREVVGRQELTGDPSVLVVSPAIRPWLSRWLRSTARGLHVLSFSEIPDNRQVRVVATVGRDPSHTGSASAGSLTAEV